MSLFTSLDRQLKESRIQYNRVPIHLRLHTFCTPSLTTIDSKSPRSLVSEVVIVLVKSLLLTDEGGLVEVAAKVIDMVDIETNTSTTNYPKFWIRKERFLSTS